MSVTFLRFFAAAAGLGASSSSSSSSSSDSWKAHRSVTNHASCGSTLWTITKSLRAAH